MKLSDKGSELLILREGLRLKAYRDVKDIWTIGVGHTGPEVVEGLVITKEKAHELFHKDVAWAEDAVNLVKVSLTQNQFDALVSFTFNVGETQFKRSTLVKKLNLGDYEGAAREFSRWVKGRMNDKLVTLPGLVSRRQQEQELFLS